MPPGHLSEKAPIPTSIATLKHTGALFPRPPRPQTRIPLGPEWMSFVPDSTPLSALSIPGTHDSAAFKISWPFVQTQTKPILQQLEAGIRYFDLRCGVRNGEVEMVHGISYLGLTLAIVLDTMYEWLRLRPSEALIVQIKQDRNPEGNGNESFACEIARCFAQHPEFWRTASSTPTLGALRGKIQLFRRYDLDESEKIEEGEGTGIDLTPWLDNAPEPFTIVTGDRTFITIQDHYTFSPPAPLPAAVEEKYQAVAQTLALSATNPNPMHWYLNFTSAYEFNFYYRYRPYDMAIGSYFGFGWVDGINPLVQEVLDWLSGRGVRTGIMAMDFASDELIEAVFLSNFEGPKSFPSWRGPFTCGVLFLGGILLLLSVIIHTDLLWV